ncbi:DUF6603 domain-containing protein [Capilliphycus salinus ALCB114379]|uniref:DUF6603 domain-containing protein n=1 Tax=Capilliphycus salinus TaxID=2768948 RepID=UPI0039A6E020
MTTNLSSAPSIVLNQDNLSEACLDDLQKYFWTRNIELFEPEQDENDPRIHRGTGTLLNVSCHIEALLNADRSLLILCAKPDEDWNFGTCFPLMPGESETGNSVGTFLLRFITIQDPIWIYIYSASEIDEQTLQTELDKLLFWNQWSDQKNPALVTKNGLYMWGGLPNNLPELQELTDFIEIDLSTFILRASLTFPDGFPILTLQLPLGEDGCKFGPGRLKQAAIELCSPLYFSPNNSRISLIGALDLNDSQQIAINIDFPLDNDLITATGTYSDNNIPFVNSSELSDLPSLQPQGAVTLELQFSKREKSLEEVSFSIDLENWTLIDNILTLQRLSFAFSVFDPLGSKMVIASIAAQASLGKENQINLLCGGYYPSNQFDFSLDSQTPLKIADLVEDLGAQSDGIPDLEINDLSAEFNLNSKDFATRVDVSGVWEIINNVELNDLRFKIYGRVAYSCEIAAEFFIAGVTLNLEAYYNGEGWQFNGSTGYGQEIPIGNLIEDLANLFGEVPLPTAIEELTIQNLGISFNTQTKDFTFTCESKFPVDSQEVDITVTIEITRQENNSFTKKFGGYIIIGDLQFNLIFSKDNTAKTFLATYNNPNRDSLKIKTLVEAVSDDIATYIPATLEITLQDALFIYSKNQTKSNFIFALNLSSQINLSNLPLVGKQFPPEQSVGVDELQFLIASQNLNFDQADNFNNLIPDNITKLPLQPTGNNASVTVVKKGLNVSANLQVGNTSQILALPIAPDSQPTTPTRTPSDTPVTTPPPTPVTDNTQWYPLKKHLGTLYFARIGIQYKDAVLWFLLDASISAAGLTLNLEGLSVGSPIKKFEPKFNLRGIGIEYESKGNISIEGAFLKTTINGKDDYSGAVIVKTKTFTISAIGSYTTTDEGHPSLFIYGILDKPIGGPPFFFVTGLALGFAYNRSLTLPTLDQIPQFPLVKAALNGAKANREGLIAIQRELQPYIPPKVGRVTLAVGIKFTSFKIIESFVLLVASFGDRFSLELLGISTLISPSTLPPNKPPLAQVRFAILARFVPSEGTLKVEGKILPDSYLFDRNCRLSGGFAFYSWFSGEHQGDFVLTVGGYHPRFQIPPHYPRVAPIALNWRISNNLSVKGSLYFALTASAIMAGGRLEAVWQSGSIKAWFIANAHFIVAWQPYFYDARIGVNLGASYTFKIFRWRKTISIEVGADLHIWGPKFSGTARIKLAIVSFTVRFGDRSRKKPKPINWSQFKQSFLPAKEEVCTVGVESGLIGKIGEGQSEIFIVNPKEFTLTTGSVIPIKSDSENQKIGIAPMAVNSSQFEKSEYIIAISQGTEDITDKFEHLPIYKNVPTGLWGESNSNNPNRERFINDVLSGYKIKPANPPIPGETLEIPRKNLAYDTESVDNAYQWESFSPFSKSEETDEDTRERNIGESINSEAVTNARNRLLQSLGLSDTDIDLEEFKTDKGIEQAFIIAPRLQETM